MTRPNTIKRSYSTSHAQPPYMVAHTVPSLGQGAQVVRTPADATSCMAQPGAANGHAWPARKHSLREPPRRPSATPSPSLPDEFSPRISSPPPTLPELDRSSSSLELLGEINDVHHRHTKHTKKKPSSGSLSFSFANPFSSSSPRPGTTPSPQTEVSTPFFEPVERQGKHSRKMPSSGSLSFSFSNPFSSISSRGVTPSPHNTDSFYDVDAEYQRRLASRTSNLTITPKRSNEASPVAKASPLPTPGSAGTSADSSTPINRSRNDHQAAASSTASIASSSTATNKDYTGNGRVYHNVVHTLHKAKSSMSLSRDGDYKAHHARTPSQAAHRPLLSISGASPSAGNDNPPPRGLARSATMPSKHAPALSTASTLAPPAPTPVQPFLPILTAHTTRVAPGPSMVLVTLRFSYSLDPGPNTHEVTVTLDTLRPAGGRLVAFLDHTLRPHSVQSLSTTTSESTPPLSTEGSEMTDGSSTEDSDFEYDDTRLHPMLQDEYLTTLAMASSPAPSPKDVSSPVPGNITPIRELSRQPSFVRRGPPPSAYPGLGFGTPLPPLSALPAALAQARAGRDAAAHLSATAPLTIRRPRSNTCPGPAKGTITELTVLLQRDASAWHTIASRLCSGSWPELAGRRRRVEDECRWAGMDALLAELQQMPTLSRRGGFV